MADPQPTIFAPTAWATEDLSARLRSFGERVDGHRRSALWTICHEAADEIERLRARVAELCDQANGEWADVVDKTAPVNNRVSR